MYRKVGFLALALVLGFALTANTVAAGGFGKGGVPAAHGVKGGEWGYLVSNAAPLGGHAGNSGNAGSNAIWALHGLESAEGWGELVSSAAQMGGLGGHAGGK